MNEKRIQEVFEIENEAQAIHEAAKREAEQLPISAEQEAQALIEKARAAAEEKARQIVAQAQSEAQSDHILTQAQEEARQAEAVALTHFDRAVAYVLSRVAGRE